MKSPKQFTMAIKAMTEAIEKVYQERALLKRPVYILKNNKVVSFYPKVKKQTLKNR